jgi:hypothetical protein
MRSNWSLDVPALLAAHDRMTKCLATVESLRRGEETGSLHRT